METPMQVTPLSPVPVFRQSFPRTAPSAATENPAHPNPVRKLPAPYFLGQPLPRALQVPDPSDLDDSWGLSDIRKGRREILSILTPDFLRKLGEKPRVHPNGFVQVDITPKKRLHIWGHPDIPKQKVAMPIHDHVYGFRSLVLGGRLVNINYEADPDGNEFDLWQPKRDRGMGGGAIEPTGERCGIRPLSTEIVVAKDSPDDGSPTGHFYDMPPWVLHETFVPEPTITLIDKDGATLDQNPDGPRPRMLVPAGRQPDVFSRFTMDEAQLWRIIDEVLADAAG